MQPVHFSLDGCPLSCYFSGNVATLWDTLSTSRSIGRGAGAFIYALPADETRAALAASRHAITALFSCRFKFLAFPCSNGIFTATRTGHKQYYTLFCKVVCHEASPFGSSNTDGAMTLARTITSSCCQQPVSMVCV